MEYEIDWKEFQEYVRAEPDINVGGFDGTIIQGQVEGSEIGYDDNEIKKYIVNSLISNYGKDIEINIGEPKFIEDKFLIKFDASINDY